MQAEEAGGGEKGQRHQKHSKVSTPARGFSHDEPDEHCDQRDPDDQRKVRWVVLPHHVEFGTDQEEDEPGEGQSEQDCRHHDVSPYRLSLRRGAR